MTEAIMVLPFLLVVWVGVQTLSRIYQHRLELETSAAAQVLAMSASGDCSTVEEESVSGAAPLREHEAGLLARLGGSNPLAMAHSRVTVSRNVASSFQAVNRGSVTVSASRVMMCNTRPAKGLLELIVADVRAMLGV